MTRKVSAGDPAQELQEAAVDVTIQVTPRIASSGQSMSPSVTPAPAARPRRKPPDSARAVSATQTGPGVRNSSQDRQRIEAEIGGGEGHDRVKIGPAAGPEPGRSRPDAAAPRGRTMQVLSAAPRLHLAGPRARRGRRSASGCALATKPDAGIEPGWSPNRSEELRPASRDWRRWPRHQAAGDPLAAPRGVGRHVGEAR